MRPPSSQQANLSGVGLEVGVAVADGVQVAVMVGDGLGVVVKIAVGLLVLVGVQVAGEVCGIGSASAQAETITRMGMIKSRIDKRDK
jgi:hypothetical protein